MAATLFMGLMSGTSMDGVDAVLVEFGDKLALHGSHAEPMPPALKEALIAISQPGDNEIDRMGELDVEVGELFARAANALLTKTGLKPSAVRAIGSHGQTIRHRPQAGHPFTLQIGDPNVIAERTGITVVADFRRRDMAAGGQGAPLVPAFHQALFRSLNHDRVIVNLGGIANITVLRRDPIAPVYGFDTGPASGLMDAWCQRERKEPFDRGGRWAASGTVNLRLLSALLAHPYFALRPPKSTGREDFHLAWLLNELGHFPGLPPEDVQATLLELTARSLTEAIKAQELGSGDVILCGGGVFNEALCKRIGQLLAGFRLHSSADFGLAPNWVEATAFAWLARQALQGMPGNLPTVTGARGARILGGIHPA